MSKITKASMGLVLAGICGYFVLSHYRSEAERKLLEKRRSDAEDAQRQQSIAALADANGAIADWRRAFGGKRAMDSLFGAELASVLVRTDHRPILFIASLYNLNTSTTGYEVEFDARANLISKVRLVLDCTPEQAAQVMHNPRDSNGRYALVARIASVKGEVADQSSAEEGKGAERTLAARGTYVQSLYIEGYWNDFVEDLQGWTDSSPEKKY